MDKDIILFEQMSENKLYAKVNHIEFNAQDNTDTYELLFWNDSSNTWNMANHFLCDLSADKFFYFIVQELLPEYKDYCVFKTFLDYEFDCVETIYSPYTFKYVVKLRHL